MESSLGFLGGQLLMRESFEKETSFIRGHPDFQGGLFYLDAIPWLFDILENHPEIRLPKARPLFFREK